MSQICSFFGIIVNTQNNNEYAFLKGYCLNLVLTWGIIIKAVIQLVKWRKPNQLLQSILNGIVYSRKLYYPLHIFPATWIKTKSFEMQFVKILPQHLNIFFPCGFCVSKLLTLLYFVYVVCSIKITHMESNVQWVRPQKRVIV